MKKQQKEHIGIGKYTGYGYRNRHEGIKKARQLPTLPSPERNSTIGTKGLNFCVRNGNRWTPSL